MTVRWRKSFKKDYRKLSKGFKTAWVKTYELFLMNPHHPKLRRHRLKGKFEGLESIDVAPDLRAIFIADEQVVVFYYIRNHNQLYS